MPVDTAELSSRLDSLRERIHRAAEAGGRSLTDVTLMAVTKTVSVPLVREAHRLGLRYFGENRVQEAEAKRPLLADLEGADWQLIGPLQTNKAKKALALFNAVQTLDSDRLANALQKEAEKLNRTVSCLVEVKTSPEPSKHGLPPEDLDRFLDARARWPRLALKGLMTVAPYFEDPSQARPFFSRLRGLAEKRRDVFGDKPVLSMGMSHDVEAAVSEGATLVRIGTALFGDRS